MTQKNIEVKEAVFDEIEDPDFFKFKDIGDKIEGKLIDVGNSDQYGFGLYTLETPSEDLIRFHGSAQLDSRMKQVNLGEYIQIEFMDVEKRPKGDMKLFSLRRRR